MARGRPGVKRGSDIKWRGSWFTRGVFPSPSSLSAPLRRSRARPRASWIDLTGPWHNQDRDHPLRPKTGTNSARPSADRGPGREGRRTHHTKCGGKPNPCGRAPIAGPGRIGRRAHHAKCGGKPRPWKPKTLGNQDPNLTRGLARLRYRIRARRGTTRLRCALRAGASAS
jgi:hypothetical protein